MSHNHLNFLSRLSQNFMILLVLIHPICLAYGASQDRKQVLTIESDSATFDHQNGINTFIGHVIMHQGSTTVTGNKMIATNNKNNKITTINIYGRLAKYRTLPNDGKGELIASARQIQYYPDKHEVILIGQAIAEQDKKIIKGPRLEYFTEKSLVISPGSQQGRTTIIYPPDTQEQS